MAALAERIAERRQWRALPGSQSEFLRLPHFEALFSGERGAGKTDALLMSFAQHVGKGWGRAWRGILLRAEATQLKDVIEKAATWFPAVWPDSQLIAGGEPEYRWATGERLLFRHARTVADYHKYHGHAYCLVEGEMVATPSGLRPVESLRAGDYVHTPTGPRRVLATFPRVVRPCLEVELFDSSMRSVGRQRQSVDHQLLTIVPAHGESSRYRTPGRLQSVSWARTPESPGIPGRGERRDGRGGTAPPAYPTATCEGRPKSSGGWYRTARQLLALPAFSPPASLCCDGYPGTLATGAGLPDQGSSDTRWPRTRSGWRRLLAAFSRRWRRAPAGGLGAPRRQPPIGCPAQHRFDGRSPATSAGLAAGPSGRPQPFAPSRSGRGRGASSDSGGAPSYPGRSAGSRAGYPTADDSGGGQLPSGIGSGLAFAPLRSGVLQPLPLCDWQTGGGGSSPARSPEGPGVDWPHPYLAEPLRTVLPWRLGFALARACGNLPTYDIAVDGAGCYLTTAGAVNKNCWMGFEEVTAGWAFPDVYLRMMSLCRSSVADIPRMVRATTNPHGPGHGWVKERFIDPAPMGDTIRDPDTGLTRVALNARLAENRVLLHSDPDYLRRVVASTNGDEMLLKAWTQGSWDIVAGGIFAGRWDKDASVLDPFQVPRSWPVYRAFDWGSSKPYAVGWFALADGSPVNGRHFHRGSVVMISELYGWNGKPNEGINETNRQIAERVKDAEAGIAKTLLSGQTIYPGPADSAIYEVRNGDSIGAEIERFGVSFVAADKGPGSRVAGWQKLGGMMLAARKVPMEAPGFFVFNTCRQWLRTVPNLARDLKHPDDVDSEQEDHFGDLTRYMVNRQPESAVGIIRLPRNH